MYSKKDSIIHLQSDIIGRYQKTCMHLNRTFMDIIRTYKDKSDRTEIETELMNFAWACNDFLVDDPTLSKLLKKLDEKLNHKET